MKKRGQLKLAPEHCDPDVLALMNKPSTRTLLKFKEWFDHSGTRNTPNSHLTYYLMAAHPGCTLDHMFRLRGFLKQGLQIRPEQVQIFTPTPSTLSTAMYYCETDPDGKPIFCEKNLLARDRQKKVLQERIRKGRR